MIRQLSIILEMIKFSHSVFALPFALFAAFLAADGLPHWGQILLIVWCMVAARSVAMTFNRVADAAIDARNPRTAGRAIPAGEIGAGAAWLFLAACAVAFFLGAAGFWILDENPWPLYLSVPVLAFLCGYSLTKRFTHLSHFWLGAALGLSPVAAWVAISPETIGWATAALAFAVLFWVGGFDLIYACQDIEVDRRERLFSLPAWLGPAAALWIARICHAVAVILLASLASLTGLGRIYLAGVGLAAGLLIVEHALVRPNDLSRINVAFLTVNGCVSLALAAAGIADILAGP